MTSAIRIFQSRPNSLFVLGMFWIAILFQMTALKNIWSIQTVSMVANTIAFLLLNMYALKTIAFGSFRKTLWYYYIIPGVLVYLGVMINVVLNVASNFELVAYFGFVLPWAAYLSMPGICKGNRVNSKILWRLFYYFMTVSVLLGLLELLMSLNGLLDFRVLETEYGVFLGGRFSLFHMLEDGTPHYRFYANFIEPGTLAMWLLPAIAYAFLSKKYFGLLILCIGLFLTDSLGGWLSFLLLVVVVFFIELNNKIKNKYAVLGVTITLFLVMSVSFSASFISSYESKKYSARVRVENISMAIQKVPTIMLTNPLGIDLALDTESNIQNEAYIGSNFMPVSYFQNGGILAIYGYVFVLLFFFLFSLKILRKYDLSLEEKVVFGSIIFLMPFIVQRTTIFESSIFAFLWAPLVIGRLSKN